jgi:hypothetical protein
MEVSMRAVGYIRVPRVGGRAIGAIVVWNLGQIRRWLKGAIGALTGPGPHEEGVSVSETVKTTPYVLGTRRRLVPKCTFTSKPYRENGRSTAAKEDIMGWGRGMRLLSVTGLTGLLAVIAATAALAQTAVYCVNGATTTLPTTLTFSGGSRALTEGTAEAVISNSFNNSTFYLGFAIGGGGPFFFIPDSPTFDPASALAPGYSTNSVSRGACAAGTRIPGIPGSSFMCASGYGAQSNPDYVAGKSATETYLAPASGRHYAFYVQGDLNGAQRAQAAAGATPAGSFYCKLPEGLKVVPIMGSDGKQMLADTQGYLYDSGYANGETIGHPAYRLAP